jgi:hypothetical protein
MMKKFNVKFDKKTTSRILSMKKIRFFSWMFTDHFLLNPDTSIFRYYLLKHLCKDHLIDAIKYDLLWMREKKWKRAQI